MLIYFIIAVVVVIGFVSLVISLLCIRKIQPGRAGVKTGWGGIKVSFDWMVRMPLVQTYHIVDISVKKLEIARKGKDGLVCKDNIRADINPNTGEMKLQRRHHRGILHPSGCNRGKRPQGGANADAGAGIRY